MKVYICFTDDDEVLAVFDSEEKAMIFEQANNIKYQEYEDAMVTLEQTNPCNDKELRKRMMDGDRDIPELIAWHKNYTELNKKYPTHYHVFYNEYDMQ
jgi:hypothetical protein